MDIVERYEESYVVPMICWYRWKSIEVHGTAKKAPPWRFSAGGRASISGIASGSVQRAPRSQVVMPGGRCPGQPAHRLETSGDGR